MGSGASHESATAAVAAGVSEEEIAAHLASLDKKPCTVYYSPFSNNSMGAAMTANAAGCAELKLVDLAGEQKSEAYLQINPYGQVPGLTDDSNGLKLGESHAILRYLATQYKPSLYPGNPASRARIDMCMDNFTNYVFLKCYGGVANCVIGELLGMQDVYPYPADQAAANAAFVEALEKWTGLYLVEGPFVCGAELTIADYRAVGLLFTIMQPKVKEKTGFVPPENVSQYVSAVFAKDPAAEALLAENTGKFLA
jgi:glutathione S-transferase